MFYYPNVLQRHSGCFSTVWLAATRGILVDRRELLKVNIRRTCGDILDYVTAQVPPPQPHQARPRFSLYLTCQLQYGVVVVFHRQCGFLLGEVQQTIDRLMHCKRCISIDVAESDRLTLDVPDSMHMMDEAEGAQDPFFGLMESHQLPSPYKMHQQMSGFEAAGSQRSLVPSRHGTPDVSGFRSLPGDISLKEKEQFVITAAERDFEGVDLPEATAREIDLLMDQTEHFCTEVKQTDGSERQREGATSSFDQLKDTVTAAGRDSVWLLDQDSAHPAEGPQAAVALEMTLRHVAMPTPPCGESGKGGDSESPNQETAAPPPRKPGGGLRRQLVFADPQVQISEGAMKEQIENRLAETLGLSEVLLDVHALTQRPPPAQLFAAPCGSLLNTDLQSLWKQSASLTALHGHSGGLWGEEEESQRDREILRTERKRRQSSVREISSESGLQPVDSSSVILDMSKEDKSISDVMTPVSKWSPQEEALLRMEPIEEENVEMPEAQTDQEARDMLRWICSSLQSSAEITFDSLVPPEADRTTAAHTLHTLLELLSARQVTVRQSTPFSDITINPARPMMTA
uniref:REC8 meiotic recombination protein b isoform X1 n=1 Tax=Gasterosteus aculeatus aculeatus TaxID=481459 RepID=UPI001A999ECF|nr:REC8 meiotic recombination protein b isoform X1 [Gasterosteus aculeatus aculeatus]